jgi:3D (Asp-Asp-Asp) domain-containing protein
MGNLRRKKQFNAPRLKAIVVMTIAFIITSQVTGACSSLWKITAYCACEKCCGKSDGITASGKKAQYGYCACNWLPFGTKVNIKGLGTFVVMDRGAKSLFGSKTNHIQHLDVYLPTHKEALKFGVKWLEVKILTKEGECKN